MTESIFYQNLVSESNLGDDFDMFLPNIDNALLGEEQDIGWDIDDLNELSENEEVTSKDGKEVVNKKKHVKIEKGKKKEAGLKKGAEDDDKGSSEAPKGKSGITTKGAVTEADKKAKRRKQIAAASRASRARRKRELEDLREENQRLREERSQFLSKIGELQVKVENMRERGSTDMRVENALLRAQLEEHKRFVSCFKQLCDGAPTTLNARHVIYKQGSDSAQAHVLGIIAQSLADNWTSGKLPSDIDIPYQNFNFFYKYKNEYGEKRGKQGSPRKQRLNVRVDLTFPGFESSSVADFMWNSFSNTDIQQRLYRVQNIELTQLADDMPDKDTKMVYYREKLEPPLKDQDWVVLCSRRSRELAKSTLSLPPAAGKEQAEGNEQTQSGFFGKFFSSDGEPSTKRMKQEVGKAMAQVLAMSTTQHSAAPQFDNANRITSMFVQGAVTWDVNGDARLVVVFSFPEDFKIKAMEGFEDVIKKDGTMAPKFIQVLREFNELIGEHGGGDGYVL
uniref:BZIP domain-containing protein n=1 Tax=Mucochytrium quahogii TaxID=96639 RepID=A0A7S2RHX7_9STRA|mmetsp:Transcript_13230/g.21516  ORF Transcript_13230/g.21516 Transcript_13230/m.21516 type:complete len:507 (+) Transcript_13230:198-1718(+)|eukprot:CAMPEP_0203756878 /NCGR_PEP_ID=MMETSP0098-20131031/10069_1 /ASSEMBLY_ACC=CAM_ASM_000208 /TAXON_ID=96639 /ORGANISM=" , Strain NY0313808BC1" /LENGTH=506 /DNA_ID=CAMNT_0050648919 /DNA_START=281 /DNA_END=1801 /DNA_ORIENTATION=-